MQIIFFRSKVNCSWSEWEEETCDCDSETKRKTRVQFKEMFGGKPCEGESELVEPCDEEELETLCKGINIRFIIIFKKEK